MNEPSVTPERVDELLRFLPAFEQPGRSFVKEWSSGKQTESGALCFPYPSYAEDVLDFFTCAGQPCWTDFAYDPVAAGRMLADDARIRTATLGEVRSMLTYCVRGERFCDGHWESVLRTGRITALLRRLAELKPSVHP